MPIFLTHVELYGLNNSAPAYARLGEEMARRRFSPMVMGGDGLSYYLPTADFYSFGELSADEVRELAVEAAMTVGYAPWPGAPGFVGYCGILVVQATRLSWTGLRKPET